MKNKFLGLISLLSVLTLCSCGPQGEKGEQGIQGEQGEAGRDGVDGKDGKDGVDGKDGIDGVSIKSITKTSSTGNVDTYTISYSDGTISHFYVTNGENGEQGIQGVPGKDGVTPTITIDATTSNWIINGVDTGICAKGNDGKSAYQIWLDNNHTGSEEDFLEWLKGQDGSNGTDGNTPYIGNNGNWWINGSDTNVLAVGTNGEDGNTPYIGDNNHWFIDGQDTGICAKGNDGDSAYQIWLNNGNSGSESDFLKWLKGQDGSNGTDGETPYIGSNGNWWIGDVDTNVLAEGTNGLTPYIGDNGNWFLGSTDTNVLAKTNSISKIVLSSSVDNVNTYTIYFTNETTFTFTVSDGVDGENGKTPYVGDNGNWWIDGKDTNVVASATVISSIYLSSSSSTSNQDTYTIKLSDGETYTFTVTNGTNGTNGETPYIGGNGNWWIGTSDTGYKSQGEKGDKGDTGKSAYELYCENNPSYTGSEEEWLHALANGDLADDITITIDTSGGEVMDAITCRPNSYIEVADPVRLGFVFDGWYLNGSLIDLNTYIFRTSCMIVAHYRAADINVALDANGGDVSYNLTTIKYGTTYTLPEPTKKYQTFDGWYNGNNKVELTGKWIIKDDCTLVAKWNKKSITATLSVDATYGECTSTSETLISGDSFTLPVPTSITASTFQGWFYGDTQITDSSGKSLGILDFDSDVTFNAKYYTEITNIYQILAMSNAESTTGNYKVMNDLDFDGVDMSPIEKFSGVFDGGGHTLSNINIVNGTGSYGGFFGTISNDAVIKNISFSKVELMGTWDCAGGLIGATIGEVKTGLSERINEYTLADVSFNVDVDNIKFDNSFNDSTTNNKVGVLLGYYFNSCSAYFSNSTIDYYYCFYENSIMYSRVLTPLVKIENIQINNSLNTNNVSSTFGIAKIDMLFNYYFNTINYSVLAHTIEFDFSSSLIDVDNISILEQNDLDHVQTFGFISDFSNANSSTSAKTASLDQINARIASCNLVNISKLYSNIKGLKYLITQNDLLPFKTTVNKSSNYGQTTYAWGGVSEINNSISTSEPSYWGAKVSNKCIDTGNNESNFAYDSSTAGSAYNCVNLVPDENGVYTYYNASGNSATISKSSLITKDFFTSMLSFDESIWDFSNLNIVTKKYPTII